MTLSLTNTDNDLFSTIYVNTTSDTSDVKDAGGNSIYTYSPAYLINNPGTDGSISIREAIYASNYAASNYMVNGVDVRTRIYFNIPTSMGQTTNYSDGSSATTYTINVHNMSVPSGDANRGLPIIQAKVIIDATTQPGFAGKPIVALDGSTWTNSKQAGFTINFPDVCVRGFDVGGFVKGIYDSGHADIVVQACYVGTDLTGTTAKPNGTGISFVTNNDASTIGGPSASDRCVIAGNTGMGISLEGVKTGFTLVENCYVGVDATGNTKMANGAQGIRIINGRSNVTITGNVISGNGTYGIDNAGTSGIIISSNYIGVGVNGTTPIGNTSAGILVEGSASNDMIGGTTAASGNIIANNGGDGIKLSSSVPTPGTVIESNNIYSNGGKGINWVGGTPPNLPVITSAVTNGSSLIRISGTLSSTANKDFRIDLFASSGRDTHGYMEGQVSLGYTTVHTDANGNASFTTDFPANVAVGQYISATATDLSLYTTSGFTQTNVTAQNVGITVTLVSGLNTTDNPPSDLKTTEDGGTAQFSVVLTCAPLFDVTIPIWSDNTGEGMVSASSLTFTQGNWNVPQVVTVTGVPDHIMDGNKLYHIITDPAVTSDPIYSGLNPANVSVNNIDTDVPGIIVTPTSGLITSENGLQATFTVKLKTRPDDPVTIDLNSSDTSEGKIDKSSLTFDSNNWSDAQTVTITGQDDGSAHSTNVNYSIVTAPATGDAHYAGIDAADVSVINVANDAAGFSVIPITPLTTTEAGGQAQFVVLLNKAPLPTTTVTIGLSCSDATEARIDKTSLTFTTADPNAADYYTKPQIVTVTGVPDNIIDGNIGYTVNFSAAVSGDPAYSGITPSAVSLTNTNIDTYNIIYVNTTSDTVDGDVTSIAALYANPGADGAISLREAILAAEGSGNTSPRPPDQIYFSIPGDGVQTINLGSTLSITTPVVIDGYTQSYTDPITHAHWAAAPNTSATSDNATILIQLSTGGSRNFDAIDLASGSADSTIRGLAIGKFDGSADQSVFQQQHH